MIATYVHTKKASESLTLQQALALNAGETVATAVLGLITPATSPALTASLISTGPTLVVAIAGGAPRSTYGIPVTVTTSSRVFEIMLVVLAEENTFNPNKSIDPGSYQDLVDDLEAGKSALATAQFQLAPSVSAAGGYVMWDVLGTDGTVYSSGNAFEYTIRETGTATFVTARAVITVPSDIPPTIDEPYQLRYLLTLPDGKNAYHYEALRVRGFPDMQIGAQDSIEMQGDLATLSLVTETVFQNYVLEIYQNNEKIASLTCANPERVARGYFVGGTLDTSALAVSLVPYQVVWKFWNTPAQTYRESCALYIVNASLIQAIDDVKGKVNKARQTLYGTPDSQFPATEIVKWLRRAGDAFNGAYGVLTSFTFTNALAGIREFWLLYAEKFALDAQYVLEGEKAFSFSGSAISLDVDRTAMLDSMASKIQAVLDNEVKPFKQNLVIKGITRGDGSGNSSGNGTGDMHRAGRTAAVGLLLTPASLFGGYRSFPGR